jgi:hypothetical protein
MGIWRQINHDPDRMVYHLISRLQQRWVLVEQLSGMCHMKPSMGAAMFFIPCLDALLAHHILASKTHVFVVVTPSLPPKYISLYYVT